MNSVTMINLFVFCNKFCLVLSKSVYPDEYMDIWKRFDETYYLKK